MAASQTYTGNGLTVTIADPENITKDECLQLARAGKDAWNAWRRTFPVAVEKSEAVNFANFADINFCGAIPDFRGFEFGPAARFNGAQFSGEVRFDGASFGNWTRFDEAQFSRGRVFGVVARFDDAQFGHGTRFDGAEFAQMAKFEATKFGRWARFDGARFGEEATFARAQFDDSASFEGAQFGGRTSIDRGARFDGAQFGDLAKFLGAQFTTRASFIGVQFGDSATFAGIQFKDSANFAGAQFGDSATFEGAQFLGDASFIATPWTGLSYHLGNTLAQRQAWAEVRGLAPTNFGVIFFDGVKFEGKADFANRHFQGRTRFADLKHTLVRLEPYFLDRKPQRDAKSEIVWDTIKSVPKGASTRFAIAPFFHGCQLHQDTSFNGAEFPNAQGDEGAARAYRTLKLAFAQQQAIREEQRFFKLEMQEEAARESGWKRWLYRGYDYFSDFGFSIWRPLARLVLWPSLGFLLGYQMLMAFNHAPMQTGPLINEPELLSQWLQFTFANLAPLPDSELLKDLRGKLFDHNGKSSLISLAALVLETAQKLLALIGYFLMGLALRNLFKMK